MPITATPYTQVYGPLALPGVTCQLWLDGADGSKTSGVTSGTWLDKSGFNNTATSNAGASAFSMGNINGLPAVTFPPASATAFIAQAPITLSSTVGFSIFFVARWTQAPSQNARFFTTQWSAGGTLDCQLSTTPANTIPATGNTYGGTTSAGADLFGITIPSNTPFMYSTVFTSTAANGYSHWLNGISGGSQTPAGAATVNGMVIGNWTTPNTAYAFIGQMGEFIVYSTALNTGQREQVEGYLAQKWGLTSQLPGGHLGLTRTLYNGRAYQSRVPLSPLPIYPNFNPKNLTGTTCKLWLDGADPAGTGTPPSTGTSVTTWTDKSDFGNHFGGSATYSLDTTYNKKGLAFNGNSFSQNNGSLYSISTAAYTIFTVHRFSGIGLIGEIFRAAPSSTQIFFRQHNNTLEILNTNQNYIVYTGTGSDSSSISGVGCMNVGNTSSAGYLNGTSFGTAVSGTSANIALFIGSYMGLGEFFVGTMFEIIIYNTSLTTNQQQQVEGYLAWKWGLQTSLASGHPNITIPPGLPSWQTSLVRGTTSLYNENILYYSVSSQDWLYTWQPYLRQLVAANSGATPSFSSSLITGATPTGYAYIGGVLAPNGKIYCIPTYATAVGVIDPVAQTFTTFGSAPGSAAYQGGVLAPNGKIYCIPYASTSVGVIDPVANTFTTPVSGSAPGGFAYLGGVLAPNGKIYCSPCGTTAVGVIDPVANTFTTFGTSPGAVGGDYSGGVLAPNGKIYCIPLNGSTVGVIDPVANTFYSNIVTGTIPTGSAYWGGVLAPNGKIYCIPHSAYTVGVIDPDLNTFTTFGSPPGSAAYIGGVLGANGKIYCMPHSSATIGVIDPVLNSFSNFAITIAAQAAFGGVLGLNGTIYIMPTNTATVCTISFTGLNQLPSSKYFLSAYTNKF